MQSVLANRSSNFNKIIIEYFFLKKIKDSNFPHNNSHTIGATKFQINRLPERKIAKEFILEKRISEENLTKCMICLNEYEDQESIS